MKTSLAAAAGLALAVLAVACSTPEPATHGAAASLPVVVATAAPEDLSDTFDAGGVVRARVVATIVGRIMAEVRSVDVAPGQFVRRGQTLVQLDARDLQAGQVRATAAEAAVRHGLAGAEADRQAAEAAVHLARVTHQRFADLRARNSATPNELDEATAALQAAESRLGAADARIAEAKSGLDAAAAASRAATVALSFATLQAPFDGVVTERLVDPGNMASPGQPLVTIEDTSGFRLEARLDESRATLVQPGTGVAVSLESAAGPLPDLPNPAAAIPGRISEVSRVLDPGSHDFLVKIDLPPNIAGLRSGMYGRATLKGHAHRGIAVPASAVVRRGQLTFVYVVEPDNRARLRMVNAAGQVATRVEISAGLVAGELVVLTPPDTLADGMLVRPQAVRPAAGAETRR